MWSHKQSERQKPAGPEAEWTKEEYWGYLLGNVLLSKAMFIVMNHDAPGNLFSVCVIDCEGNALSRIYRLWSFSWWIDTAIVKDFRDFSGLLNSSNSDVLLCFVSSEETGVCTRWPADRCFLICSWFDTGCFFQLFQRLRSARSLLFSTPMSHSCLEQSAKWAKYIFSVKMSWTLFGFIFLMCNFESLCPHYQTNSLQIEGIVFFFLPHFLN